MHLEPDPADRWDVPRVLAALGRDPGRPRPRSARHAPFVGREAERARLVELLGAPAGGPVVVARIEGDPGCGKTALADELCRAATRTGAWTCLRSRCHPQDRATWKVFEPWIADLARGDRLADADPADLRVAGALFPVLLAGDGEPAASGGAPGVERLAAVEAIGRLLRVARPDGRIVLHVDDAQWGDAASGRVLAEVLDAHPALRPLVACTLRRGAESAFLAAFREEAARRCLPFVEHAVALGALDLRTAEALARSVAGAPEGDPSVLAAARECGGNAFLCVELARVAREHTRVGDAPTVERLVEARVAAVPARARQLVRLAAVAGGPVPQALLLESAGLGPEGRADLQALCAAGLVRVLGARPRDPVELTHDRVRDALEAGLDADGRRGLHRSLAGGLASAADVAAEVVAHHFDRAGVPDEAARHYTRAAVQARGRLAFESEAAFLERALAWTGWTEDERQRLRVDLAGAVTAAGRTERAGEAWLEAAAHAPGPHARTLRLRGAESYLAGGHVGAAVTTLAPVLAELDLPPLRSTAGAALALAWHLVWLLGGDRAPAASDPDPRERERLSLAWTWATSLSAVLPFPSNHLQVYTVRRALAAGDVHVAARGLAFVGVALSVLGAWMAARGERLLAEGEALAARSEDRHTRAFARVCRSYHGLLDGDRRGALDGLTPAIEALADARYPGASWERTTARGLELMCLDAMGRHAAVRALAARWLAEASDRGDLYGYVVSAQFLAFASLVGGQTEHARGLARTAIGRWPLAGFTVQHLYSLRIEVYADLLDEDPAAGRARLEAAWPLAARAGMLEISLSAIDLLVLRGRVLLAHGGPAKDVREALAALGRWKRADVRAHEAALRAGLALAEGRADEAAAGFAAAAARYASLGMELLARCAERRAAALAGADTAACDAAIRELGGHDPARLATVLAPGAPPGAVVSRASA
ncbi:MAG: ATP-binding protein [Myxococcota bacterium]